MRFVQLSDVCDLQNGFAFKSTDYVEKSNTCNIRMSNIRPGGSFNEFHNERYLPDSYAKEYKDYLLNDGDLIIAMTDMATETKILGLPTLVNNTSGRSFLLNQRVGKLCKFSKDIYVPYLRHILTSQDVIDYYKSKGAGGLQINISKKDILSVKFPLPAIPTQKKIVAKLDAIFAEIDTATAAAEANANNAEALFQSYLTKVFERAGEGWKLSTLGEYYDVRDGTHDSPKFQDLGYPLVTSKNLKNGNINFEKIQYISKEDYLNISQRSGVKKGDVLMAMIGTIGNPVVVDTDNEFAIKNVALFKTNNSQSPKFLSYYLSSDYVIKKMEKDAKGTTQKFVGLGYLRSFPIKVPNKSSQEKVVETLGNYENHIKILSKSYVQKLNELLLLKQSILQKAFSGELVKD